MSVTAGIEGQGRQCRLAAQSPGMCVVVSREGHCQKHNAAGRMAAARDWRCHAARLRHDWPMHHWMFCMQTGRIAPVRTGSMRSVWLD